MLHAYIKTLISTLTLLILFGCSISPTEPFTSFIGDPVEDVYIDDKKITRQIRPSVIMPVGDKHSESCRFSGTIILPDNLTYSSYVEQVLKNSLRLSDLLANETDVKAPKLKIILNNVNFDSYSGNWIMWGTVYINEKRITSIYTSTTFKSTFDNELACSLAIDKFDDLSRKFILSVLYDPKVMKSIKQG